MANGKVIFKLKLSSERATPAQIAHGTNKITKTT